MSFRDDHEAALARVAALEEEAERLKRDNERLAAENADLRNPPKPPKPEKPPRPKRTPSERALLIRKLAPRIGAVVVGGGLFALMVIAPMCVERANEREYKAELAAYERQKEIWTGLLAFEDCARDTLREVAGMVELDPRKQDPRTNPYPGIPSLNKCALKLSVLATIPTLTPAKQALDEWLAAHATLAGPHARIDEYYENRDWKDDNYAAGPKLWADFIPPLQAFHAATAAALAKAAPLARAEIRAIQRAYEDKRGKDPTWWRIEVGYMRNELASMPAFGATQDAVLAKATELRQLMAKAPLELRRDWRQLADELDWVERGSKSPHELSDYYLWEKTTDDGIGPVPKRPQRKEGCGGDGGAV